jgi:hypothetical protein
MAKGQDVFSVEDLYGRKPASEASVRKGMVPLERELAEEFKAQRAEEEELARHMDVVRDGLLPERGKDRLKQAVEGLKKLDAKANKAKLSPPDVEPHHQRIFLGSVGATVVPAYNYGWTWNAQSGGPALNVSANRNNGQISAYVASAGKNANGSARAAVGIYFRPMTRNGILRLWSNPAFNYLWWTYCVMRSAHSSAYIGLYVARYTLSGGLDGVPVDQKISLWSDNSWWSGAGSHRGANSGYPLSAQFNVSSSFYYALWVWCGVRASGGGWGLFSGSGAGSRLNVTVPSISWELFGG